MTSQLTMINEPPTIIFNKLDSAKKNITPQVSNLERHYRKVEQEQNSEDGSISKKIYTIEFRNKIVKARSSLKLTQKQFAQKLNLKEAIIKGIENGTAVYDCSIVEKINNQLQRLKVPVTI